MFNERTRYDYAMLQKYHQQVIGGGKAEPNYAWRWRYKNDIGQFLQDAFDLQPTDAHQEAYDAISEDQQMHLHLQHLHPLAGLGGEAGIELDTEGDKELLGNKVCPKNLQVLECKHNKVLSHKVDADGCPAYFCKDKAKGGAAVAKPDAIKNREYFENKDLQARIHSESLEDLNSIRKMKAIEEMKPQMKDMERRLGIMQSVEPVLENAIKTLQKVVDVRGMGKK